ncbi:MAG: sugar kinase [Pseudomonadota bacterium]
MTASLLSVGECMAELSRGGGAGAAGPLGSGWRLGFGGDTLNTAVYLARLRGAGAVGYVTRVGDDVYSRAMADAWAEEGLDPDCVEVAEGRTIGLYAIETDPAGERRFAYWRDQAPARGLFTEGDWRGRVGRIAEARLVYFSGITLAILPEAGRARLIEAAAAARAAGAIVAVDPNHRPRLWSAADAALWLDRAYRAADIVLTSAEEEAQLFGVEGVQAALARLSALGVRHPVAKAGDKGAFVLEAGAPHLVAAQTARRVVDTTGAGDSFNAGFLAAALDRASDVEAAAAGCALGARVVVESGAIIARDAPA